MTSETARKKNQPLHVHFEMSETVRKWRKVWVETGPRLKFFKWVYAPGEANREPLVKRAGEVRISFDFSSFHSELM